MSTNAIQPAAPMVVKEQYAVTVRRARNLLNYLFWLLIFSGVITTVISFYAVYDADQDYGPSLTVIAQLKDLKSTAFGSGD